MQLGTVHGAGNRLSARLERAVSTTLAAVGGGRGRFGGLRAQSLLRLKVLTALAVPIVFERTDVLYGLQHDQQVFLGDCQLDQRRLQFDVWSPHFGIAVDYTEQTPEELECKRSWCESKKIAYAYVSPKSDQAILDGLKEMAERRKGMM